MQMIRTDEITGLWTYLASIDWTEPWFLGLGAFHLICIATTVMTRNHATIQAFVFAFFLIIVGCSEYINELAAKHWNLFARQQYFDSNGLFISVVISAPLLLNCVVIVMVWLKTSASLMSAIRVKRLQQQQQQEAQQKDTTEAVDSPTEHSDTANGATDRQKKDN